MELSVSAATPTWVREPAVAGCFYPADAAGLEQMVRGYLDEAGDVSNGCVRALVVPHAGYRYSGAVAAHAFKTLVGWEGACPTVYVIGPAHWQPVKGVALSSAHSFATPLGLMPVARRHVDYLLQLDAGYAVDDAAHDPEHCIEMQIPFLQVVLGRCQIVPMLVGRQVAPEEVSKDLIERLGHEPSLLVVSSDLSHGRPLDETARVDHELLESVLNGDLAAVQRGSACGLIPLLCLMRVARHFGWRPQLMAYQTSADVNGDRTKVVGYAALVYSDPNCQPSL